MSELLPTEPDYPAEVVDRDGRVWQRQWLGRDGYRWRIAESGMRWSWSWPDLAALLPEHQADDPA